MIRPEIRTHGAIAALAIPLLAACGAVDRPDAPISELTTIESPAAPGSAEPNLFGTSDGRLYMSWLEPAEPVGAASTRRGEFALRVAELDIAAAVGDAEPAAAALPAPGAEATALADRAWSEPATVARGADFFVNWADFPSVVALPDGSLAAHWLVRSGPGSYAYDVHVAHSTDGGRSWSESVVPHRDGTQTEHGFVSLFPWHDGRLAAVWLDGREFPQEGGSHGGGGEMTLRHTLIGSGGSLADERLLDGRVCDCCQTSAASTAQGPVVVYRDRSGDEVRDISIVRFVDGAWTEPAKVYDDGWMIPACPVNGPAVGAAGRRVAVAWYTAANDTARVRIAFSADAGASFGEPVRLDDGDPLGRVDLQMLPDGAALVSWLENSGDGDAEVRLRRVEPDGAAEPAVTIGRTSAGRPSGFPRMALAGDRVVLAWTVPGEPSRIRIAAARWES